MTRLAIAINLDRCVGCHTCALSCKMQNNVPEGMLWNRVLTQNFKKLCNVEALCRHSCGKQYSFCKDPVP